MQCCTPPPPPYGARIFEEGEEEEGWAVKRALSAHECFIFFSPSLHFPAQGVRRPSVEPIRGRPTLSRNILICSGAEQYGDRRVGCSK